MFIDRSHLLWKWLFSKKDMCPTVYIDPTYLTPSVRRLVGDLVVTWNCWNTINCHHMYCIHKNHMKTSPVERNIPEICSWYSVFNVPILFSLLYVASHAEKEAQIVISLMSHRSCSRHSVHFMEEIFGSFRRIRNWRHPLHNNIIFSCIVKTEKVSSTFNGRRIRHAREMS